MCQSAGESTQRFRLMSPFFVNTRIAYAAGTSSPLTHSRRRTRTIAQPSRWMQPKGFGAGHRFFNAVTEKILEGQIGERDMLPRRLRPDSAAMLR